MDIQETLHRIKQILVGVPLISALILFVIGTILLIFGLTTEHKQMLPDLPLEPTVIVPSDCLRC